MNDKAIFVCDKQESSKPFGMLENICFWTFLTYFLFKTTFFALKIREKVFPDESTWFGISELFSRSYMPPIDSAESFSYGLVTHIPKLYFILMGKALAFNTFTFNDLTFLRFINVLIGGVTVFIAWKLVVLLSESMPVRLLFIVLLTNTIMYTFTFSGVSYDNLTNLLAVLTLYFLMKFFDGRHETHLLLFYFFLLLGTLTKITFLPYAFFVAIVLIFHQRYWLKSPQRLLRSLSRYFCKKRLLLTLCCLSLLAINVNLYVGNLLKYGFLLPEMHQVVPLEHSLNYRLYAGNYVAKIYSEKKVTYVDAQRIALRIRDPGDRAMAFSKLKKIQEESGQEEKERMSRLGYSLEWFKYVFTRTYGIAAHLGLPKGNKDLMPYYFVFGLSGILLLLKLRTRSLGCRGFSLLFITLSYILLLMQKVNYGSYTYSGMVGLALTGRYIFPVLVPLYILIAYGLMEKMPRWWQWGVGLAVSGIFIYGEFPWFLKNVTPNWYF